MPNDLPDEANGLPRVCVRLARGWPKMVRYDAGFVNLREAPWREYPVGDALFTEADPFWTHRHLSDALTPARFRDPRAGWVARGVAAPFVRILEVRDPTAEDLAAPAAAEEGE